MTIVLPDQYPTLESSGRRLATVGNRIGSNDEYGELVDRDTWLFANLSRNVVFELSGRRSSATLSTINGQVGDVIADIEKPVAQPCRGITLKCMYATDTGGGSDAFIEYEAINADTLVSLGTGTFALSGTFAKVTQTLTFPAGVSNIIFQSTVAGTIGSVQIYGYIVRELPLEVGDLP